MGVALPWEETVAKAVARIRSFSEGDRGVLDVIACGSRAIPSLRELLFSIDSSGIPDARIRAVEALHALGAQETLIDFLTARHFVADPVAQLEEDAVVSAAARKLDNPADDRILTLLLELARDRLLAGLISALGRTMRQEAIPELVRALAEDETRHEAENALRNFGAAARAALVIASAEQPFAGEIETESHSRQRRSALKLLSEIG